MVPLEDVSGKYGIGRRERKRKKRAHPDMFGLSTNYGTGTSPVLMNR